MDFNTIDHSIARFMNRWGVLSLRVSLGIIFIWFGILKPLGFSPAEPLVLATVQWLPVFDGALWVNVIGWWEVAIGVTFTLSKNNSYCNRTPGHADGRDVYASGITSDYHIPTWDDSLRSHHGRTIYNQESTDYFRSTGYWRNGSQTTGNTIINARWNMVSGGRNDRMNREEILLVYDGDCPVCNAYSHIVKIRESVGELRVIDARERSEVMEEITEQGFDIDQGMVLKMGGQFFYGSDAMHVLALIGSRSDTFNRVNYWVFKSKSVSSVFYPVLRFLRNILLKVSGKSKINNLKTDA